MKIMVLAGGNDQAALIRLLRERIPGVEVILIDYNKDVVAAKYADRHIVESTMDLPKVKEIALREKVDYIMTACGDQPVLTMAVISDELGLPCYLTKRQAVEITNKKFMKRIMLDNDIPTSRFRTFEEGEPIDDAGLRYPLIVKPVDNNGSKGVRRVENKDELQLYAVEAYKFSLTKTIIVEEFIEGDEISCDFFVKDGVATYVMICKSNKFFVDGGTQVIYQSIIPPSVSNVVRQRINDIAQKIATVAIRDEEYHNKCRERLIATRKYTEEQLRALGFTMPESAANFVFAKPPKEVPAGLLYKNLREKGILVRYFDKDVLRDYLRITIGTDEEMRALVEACTEEIKNVQNS